MPENLTPASTLQTRPSRPASSARDPRFITRDPLEAVTGQLYAYAGDDPVNFDDPSGLILGIPGTPSWNTLGACLVGAVDGATSGLTSGFRDAFGLNGGLDKCSSDDQISRAGGRFAANLDVGIATGAQLHLRPRWQPTTSGSGATTNLQYDGGHQIAGLDHFAARYYDPGIARWTQQDPINQITRLTEANRYSYMPPIPSTAVTSAELAH